MWQPQCSHFASCNKDNSDDNTSSGGGNSSANYPETIVSTNWNWESSEPTNGFVRVGVFFGENNNFTSVTMEKAETHLADIYIGTYSYSTGSGSMSLEDQGSHTTASATFSINGTTMTFKINGGYRNHPLWEVPIEFRRAMPEVPILTDPSHISGCRELLQEVAQSALDLGFDGLMVEVHPHPEETLTDARQQVTPQGLQELLSHLVFRQTDSAVADDVG